MGWTTLVLKRGQIYLGAQKQLSYTGEKANACFPSVHNIGCEGTNDV